MMTVAYDGTNYCGSQIQKNGETIQGIIDRELSSWLNEDIKTIGASRTDAGVHARGNVFVFDTKTLIPGEKYAFGLNTKLPDDIKIQGSREVPLDFHPRFANTVKTYEYKILNRIFPDPLRRNAYFTHTKMDINAMKKAVKDLEGEHDFISFAAAGNTSKTTVRTIYSADIFKEDDLITLRITGNGFLYNMVRIVAGTLLEIGKGSLECDCIPKIIDAKDRNAAGPTAPAKGLTLVKIEYK